jgi:uncharacterized protein (TIGR03083 family)
VLASPRYEGPVIISMSGEPSDQLVPFTRQRRRLQAMLEALGPDDWAGSTRCDQWSVQDVVAHLVGVNAFWQASVQAGLAGTPTRFLAGFDPAVTPGLIIEPMRALPPDDVLEQFVASNDSLLAVFDGLDDRQWMEAAETPAGHVAVRVVAHHGLWDCWVHERDIALPLGLTPPVEPDELRSSLRYVSALGPAFALSTGRTFADVFAVEADDPDESFVLEVDDCVAVRGRDEWDRDECGRDGRVLADEVCLRGGALMLVEALSLRTPLPASAPIQWRELLGGLATAFDVEMKVGP